MSLARYLSKISQLINSSGQVLTGGIADSNVTGSKLENNIALPGTGSMTLPKGTSAQRPSSAEGLIRFNTDKKTIEAVLSTQWQRDWFALTNMPGFYGFNSLDTTGVTGWKTIRITPDFNAGLSGASVYNTSNGRFTPNEPGWYVLMFNHLHANGSHGAYRMRIMHGTFGAVGHQWTPGSDSASIIGVSYFDGAGMYCTYDVYHDNSSHPDSNTERMIYQSAFRIIGADNT
jgi:hypothetical protein